MIRRRMAANAQRSPCWASIPVVVLVVAASLAVASHAVVALAEEAHLVLPVQVLPAIPFQAVLMRVLRAQAVPVRSPPVRVLRAQVVAVLAVVEHPALPVLPAEAVVAVAEEWTLRRATPWSEVSAASTPTASTPTEPRIRRPVRAKAGSSCRT